MAHIKSAIHQIKKGIHNIQYILSSRFSQSGALATRIVQKIQYFDISRAKQQYVITILIPFKNWDLFMFEYASARSEYCILHTAHKRWIFVWHSILLCFFGHAESKTGNSKEWRVKEWEMNREQARKNSKKNNLHYYISNLLLLLSVLSDWFTVSGITFQTAVAV